MACHLPLASSSSWFRRSYDWSIRRILLRAALFCAITRVSASLRAVCLRFNGGIDVHLLPL